MKSKIRFSKFLILSIVILFIFLLLKEPQGCYKGVASGLLLCGRVIIPSLFPFTVCVLFIMKSGILKHFKFLNRFTKSVFALTPELFAIMLFSCVGGYPIGAKLLNEAVTQKKIIPEKAGVMLNYCINAGPAFIISAVGSSIIGSKILGVILLVSHISASLIICFICRFENNQTAFNSESKQPCLNFSDNFVLSTSEAASSVFSICGFVILFSCINSYIELFSLKISQLKYISYILEVTNAVTLTNNIYLISFLLGFAGLCIWCQVLAVGSKINIKFPKFIFFRIFHGILSAIFTFIILKITKIPVPTLSNNRSFDFTVLYSTPSLAISMLIMCIILIISFSTKKYTGKILEDMV